MDSRLLTKKDLERLDVLSGEHRKAVMPCSEV